MGRPNLTEKRSAQILDAVERCVARDGVDGTTLESVAKEAGLARALIRHHVGNREQMIEKFVSRFLGKAETDSEALFVALPAENRTQTMLEWLFDPNYMNIQYVRITYALLNAASEQPELRSRLRRWTEDFILAVTKVLHAESPDADEIQVRAAATGIVGIYFNVDSLSPLGMTNEFKRDSLNAAEILANSVSD